MGVCGSNAPSESAFSVPSDRRGHTGADWAETQVRVHRNFDVVKKLRALGGAKPGQPLSEVWGENKSSEEGKIYGCLKCVRNYWPASVRNQNIGLFYISGTLEYNFKS